MPERQDKVSGYTCREVVDLVTEYLEGAMTPKEKTAFELHLNYCDGCSTFLEQIKTTAVLAGGLSEEQIPHAVMTALQAAFRERRRA
jgi:predicted anti-sigma-YlaC factor YlaD